MRRRFFVERFADGRAVMQGDAAHHLGRVLRAEPGQLYELSDGQSLWLAKVARVDRGTVEFSLVESLPVVSSAVRIRLLLAIVKFDAFEWALEKSTELGADEIVPLAAERSEKGLIAAAAKRAARWRKILLESAQQSRRLQVPELLTVKTPAEAFSEPRADFRVLLSERPGAPPLRAVFDREDKAASPDQPMNVAVAVGPEGGWTDREVAAAAGAGFAEAGLGSHILRTETAVCAVLAAVQYRFGGLQHLQPGDDFIPPARKRQMNPR